MDQSDLITDSQTGSARLRRAALFAAVVLSYTAAAKLGLVLFDPVTRVTPIWPAAGVALGVFLRFSWRRMWLPVAIGVCLGDYLTVPLRHAPFNYGALLGNNLGPLLGAWLVVRFANGRRFLEHPQDVGRFVLFGAGVSGIVSATFGVLALCLWNDLPWRLYGQVWTPWCVSDVMGALLLVPPFLAWSQRLTINRRPAKWWLEVATLTLGGAAVTQFSFLGRSASAGNYSLEYLCIPMLLWAAFRFPGRGVTTLVLGAAVLAIINTRTGWGPFAKLNQSLTLLQVYLGSTALLALVTAAVVKERETQARTLHLQTETLRRTVAEAESARLEAEAARAAAERANAAKSEFLSRMSHELRTPMNAILGFGQLLEIGLDGPAADDSVQHILKAGRHLLALIDEVLDISRIEAGRLVLSLQPLCLRETTAAALRLLEPLAAPRGIRLEMVRGCAGLYVLADKLRFHQALFNLLSNAVKFNRVNGTVRVSCERRLERVRVLVSDTGEGISEAGVAKLFVPFERLDANERNIDGSGIGLALSKRLIECQDGQIGVHSRQGEGSTFWIELPLTEAPAAAAAVTGADSAAGQEAAPAPKVSTMLYIEDNLSNFALVELIFKRYPQVRLIAAMQGVLGVEMAQRHQPDLILLDLQLPDILGDEVLRRLQADPVTREISVVILSADAMPQQVERLRAAGVREYLTKPLDVRKLLSVAEDILGIDTLPP